MKSTAFFSAGGAGLIAALLSYIGHDGNGSAPSLISALLGGGGLLSIILGFIPDGKKPNPDGGGAGKPDDNAGLSFSNFSKALAMYKAAKAVGSPGDAKLTKEEITSILRLFVPEVASEITDDEQPAVAGPAGRGGFADAAKYAQFVGQLMQLKPVTDAFKTNGGAPAYTEMLLVWSADVAVPVKLGVDPRTAPAPVKVA